MKKTLVLLSAALLLAACSNDNNKAADTSTAATTAAPGATPKAGSPIKTCNIETAAAKPFSSTPLVVTAGGKVRFTGWAIDTQEHAVPKAAVLLLASADGSVTRDAPIVMWRARPDVVAKNGDDAAYQESGFSVDVPTSGLAAGSYAAMVRYSDGRTCDVGRHVTVQ